MCGIAGIASPSRDDAVATCSRMVEAIRHRGPDGSGQWNAENVPLALGHRRLAILDLSENGCQPMVSPSGRFVLTFNGEIYNFASLRDDLRMLGHRFRSDSDTEVLLAAVEQYGVLEACKKLRGMFAFAAWDATLRKLYLVRDRVGIKPLYYGWIDGGFAFASELHALRAIPDWQPGICRNALTMYMRYGYIPTPFSIYKGVYKLPPGTILSISRDQFSRSSEAFSPFPDDGESSPKRFWNVVDVYHRGHDNRFTGTRDEAVAECERLLSDAIEARMVSDVPLGAFLSGGIDSSTTVTLMQALSSKPIRTFTIGVEGHTYDESEDAKKLAKHLGTDHTEYRLSSSEALDVVPNLQAYYDEPFADSSQIPTYLLSQITRQHVTVALSGDGGDEVFGGYNRYIHSPRILEKLGKAPMPVRNFVAKVLMKGPWTLYGLGLKGLAPVLPESLNDRWLEITIPKIADLLESRTQAEFYDRVTLLWPTDDLVLGGRQSQTLLSSIDGSNFGPGSHEMRCRDLMSYHVDDILTKVDRASMAVSLEVRVPFIDHQVIEFAACLPEKFIAAGGEGKLLLREILKKRLPSEFQFGTNKRGFSIPLASWLRGPLRDWAESLLNHQRIESEGFLNVNLVRATWQDHLSGSKEWSYRLWNVLMFQAFLETHHQRVA